MRRQYHFRPLPPGDDGSSGRDAWDVHELIALAADLPVFDVDVSSIQEVDTVYWFDHIHPPTVRGVLEQLELITEVETSYPIILGADGRVMDGMHRVARALLEGRSTITAVQFAVDPEPDYRNCDPADLSYEDRPL